MTAPMIDALPDDFGSLIRGAIDVHVHGQPDLATALANRGSDRSAIELARAYGIEGWVLKSHLWPTTDRAKLLREQLADVAFTVYGSITLNPLLGPLSVTTVELAAAHDARVVFLPTWGTRADVERDGYVSRLLTGIAPSFADFAATNAITIADGNGRLLPVVKDVVSACAQLGLSLATGHIALAESTALAEHCAIVGFERLLITHPLHYVDDPSQLRRFSDLGAFVEFSNAPLLHPDGHLHIRDIYQAIEILGPEQIVLTTDVFSRWVPPEPECLRMFAEQLHYLGCSSDQLHTMLADNPRRFLDWSRDHPPAEGESR
jgi:sugar phosphate isomerase/epimerase